MRLSLLTAGITHAKLAEAHYFRGAKDDLETMPSNAVRSLQLDLLEKSQQRVWHGTV